MIFFFDRNIGTRVPEALIRLKPDFEVEYHQRHFEQGTEDDKWLGEVAELRRLRVHPDLQRRGLGQWLLSELESRARACWLKAWRITSRGAPGFGHSR